MVVLYQDVLFLDPAFEDPVANLILVAFEQIDGLFLDIQRLRY